jgi:hypothetical protein
MVEALISAGSAIVAHERKYDKGKETDHEYCTRFHTRRTA